VTSEKIKNALAAGETIAVEFKRCDRDFYLGIEDDGAVSGIPENAAPDMVKNFNKTVSNPDIINPTVYLTPEIVEYEGRQIIHIHIPPSSEVHTCKRVVYDRVDDADEKVTATGLIHGRT